MFILNQHINTEGICIGKKSDGGATVVPQDNFAMAELGNESFDEHKAIVEIINKYKWTNVVLVGGNFLKIEHPYISFKTSNEARKWLIEQNLENTHLLIKGSRSIKMEKVLES